MLTSEPMGSILDFHILLQYFVGPIYQQETLFAKVHEGCRKDVERESGRMLAKWHVLARVGRSWKLKYSRNILATCFILHNMTLRDHQSAQFEAKAIATVAAAAVIAATSAAPYHVTPVLAFVKKLTLAPIILCLPVKHM